MMKTSIAVLALSATLSAATAHAGDCDGDPGWVLDMQAESPIGAPTTICLSGPANEGAFFMASLGEGPIDSAYGQICLDFPLLASLIVRLDDNGSFCFDADIPFDPAFEGLTIYAQFLTCRPNRGLSNQSSTTITIDEVCDEGDAISSNFNGTDIDPGHCVWFNSIVKVKDLETAPAAMQFKGGEVRFESEGTDYTVALPDALIIVSDTATEASTVFDPVRGRWQTTVPSGYSGNIFLTGVSLCLPEGLAGGANPVDWSGRFSSDTCGVELQWKWAAAVYTEFPDDPGAIGVKPIDGDKDNPYPNSDHAGTPENFKDFVTGGARGGGGSNFTGSYSGTSSVRCDDC